MNVTFVTCLLSFSSFLSNSSGFGCQSSNSPFLNVLSDYANSNLQISETGTYPSSIGTISFSVLSHDGSYCGYLLRDAKTSEFIRAYLGDTDPRVSPDFSIDSLFMENAATPQFSLLPTRSTSMSLIIFPPLTGRLSILGLVQEQITNNTFGSRTFPNINRRMVALLRQ